jgi:hypothetical protein
MTNQPDEDNEPDYDVVLHALQLHRDKLLAMSNSHLEWGIMDQLRMPQIAELDKAIAKRKAEGANK